MKFRITWEIAATAAYITKYGFKRVALQFPDELLGEAASVTSAIQDELSGYAALVFVLADTTYNSFSTDEVAAEHVDADCVVHYGHASLSKVQRLPTLVVLPKQTLDVAATSSHILQTASTLSTDSDKPLVVILDLSFHHCSQDIQQLVEHQRPASHPPILFAQVPSLELWPPAHPSHSLDTAAPHPSQPPPGEACSSTSEGTPPGTMSGAMGLTWSLPAGCTQDDCTSMWVGPSESPFLTCLQLSLSRMRWQQYDPTTGQGEAGPSRATQQLLKRRYFLTERARGASIIGILVGTLGTAGYLEAIKKLQAMAKQAGKKTYTMLMGKPNVAKLANFLEVEVWVMVADPLGLVLDSRDYMVPIITPFEASIALQHLPWPDSYTLGFEFLLDGSQQQLDVAEGHRQPDEGASGPGCSSTDGECGQLVGGTSCSSGVLQAGATQGAKAVAVRTGADYLTTRRTYQGLQTPAVGGEVMAPSLAVKGRHGRAAGYVDEPQQQ